MDWNNKSWSYEDEIYKPKRKTHNKGSHFFHHNSGSLYSHKMKREIGYESFWGEYLFYYYLELDPYTVRYYPQPVEIEIPRFQKSWLHIPDVLIFRNGCNPILCQIKGGDAIVNQKEEIRLACESYALDREWSYLIIQPKMLPEVLKSNVLTLSGFLRTRGYYTSLEAEAIQKLRCLGEAKIIDLARSFIPKTDYRLILPLIFHLIARGRIKTNIYSEINEKSTVALGSMHQELAGLFNLEE